MSDPGRHPPSLSLILLCALALAPACAGHIGGDGAEDVGPTSAEAPTNSGTAVSRPNAPEATGPTQAGSAPAPASFVCKSGDGGGAAPRLWRLTPVHYASSAKALLGKLPLGFRNPLTLVQQKDKFENQADPNGMDELVVEQSVETAATLGAALATRTKSENACLASPNAACFTAVATKVGAQVFRRPLTAEETERFGRLMADKQPTLGTDLALSLGIEAMLLSPHFLFRTELGDGKPDASGRVRLTPHEVAAAISYTFADGPPDAELMSAAAQGQLATADQIRKQVLRLVPDPGKSEPLVRFVRQYYQFDAAADVFKDAKLYPFHRGSLLVSDSELFVRDVLTTRTDFVGALLTSRNAWVRASTAPSYGITEKLAANGNGQKVELPAAERAGLLTHPSFLVAFSEAERNDTIVRGRFVRTRLLCGAVPDVPIGVVTQFSDDPKVPLRQRLETHLTDPTCRACHALMDPLGFAFEAYDHLGRFRSQEAGKPVNASGDLTGSGNQDGPFGGAVELSQRLARSTAVEECLVRNAFRFAVGRDDVAGDSCSLVQALGGYRRGGDLLDLFAALIASDTYLTRRLPQ